MNTEKEYFENFLFPNFYSLDYSLDVKDKDNSFQEQYYQFFSPDPMTNNEFVDNFMKIDYSMDLLSSNRNNDKPDIKSKDTNIHNDSVSTHSSLNLNQNIKDDNNSKTDKSLDSVQLNNKVLCSNNDNILLKCKKGRSMLDSNLIIDEFSDQIYDNNVDPVEYKKARKRMQNRESAVRSRQKKKESVEYLKTENQILKKENYRLYYENSYLKKEKNFLIDQIKFMQNLIKTNGMVIKPYNCTIENNDIEKNLSVDKQSNSISNNKIVLNGERQKPPTKLFSVFMICILSIFYISSNSTEIDSNEKIIFKGGSTITLNDDNTKVATVEFSFTKLLHVNNFIKLVIIIVVSMIILNMNRIWYWIKKFVSNNKKLYKNL